MHAPVWGRSVGTKRDDIGVDFIVAVNVGIGSLINSLLNSLQKRKEKKKKNRKILLSHVQKS